MYKTLLPLLLIGLLSCNQLLGQQVQLDNVGNRPHLSLNGKWSYLIDPYATGYYDYRYQPNPNGFFKSWPNADKTSLIEYSFEPTAQLNVPGDWNHQKPELLYYEGNIWYQRKFDFQPKAGMKQLLSFGGVNYHCRVWLNGKLLGTHTGGFTAFAFDASKLIKSGTNILTVLVNNERKADAVPTLNTDWWNYGGITRDVLLIEEPELFVKTCQIRLADLSKGQLEINGVLSKPLANAVGGLTISIPELGLKTGLKTTDTLFQASLSSNKIKYWSPETPKTYRVMVTNNQGQTLWQDEVGFRKIEVSGEKVLLNGKPIFLRGICIHEEIAETPRRAYSEADALQLLTRAKDLGCNFVRLAHYPHNENMTRMADKLGMLVWSEIPVYWTIQWQNEQTLSNALTQLDEMVRRDYNRSSVIVWSVGNETPVSEARNRFMKTLARRAKTLDQSRLVSAAMEKNWNADKTVMHLDDPLGDEVDVLSCNEYLGWYEGLPARCKEVKFETKLRKPLIISEFGGEALFGFHADSLTRFSEEMQADMYVQQLAMLDKIPNLVGMTPWIMTDFRSPKRLHGVYQQGWNRKGVYSDRGDKKQSFHILKAYYDIKARQLAPMKRAGK